MPVKQEQFSFIKESLLVSKDKEVLEFAENHLLTEKNHLELIEKYYLTMKKVNSYFYGNF